MQDSSEEDMYQVNMTGHPTERPIAKQIRELKHVHTSALLTIWSSLWSQTCIMDINKDVNQQLIQLQA